MAVREALLASLIPGPGYGFQLHGALTARTGGRRQVNVGQSYATLERATKAKLIEAAGTTEDGLPLHRLTATGRGAADAWLGGEDASGADPWDETVDRVLIAASLPGVDVSPIVAAEGRRWRERLEAAEFVDDAGPESASGTSADPALAALARAADAARARAAIDWLERVAVAVASGPSLELVPSAERPRRGRRPSAPPESDADPQPSAIA
ncbi:PadR family transcriptional regulator [Agromyces lapidis]|uniref:PadR family transcriptional regulator n=1 Tax=Agromyces lapidis TaxID=279574 RepID=A0ABV5SUD4_9MICO|nr:helix-turn-helix transcriptional regulator [Agromyces lapidis]